MKPTTPLPFSPPSSTLAALAALASVSLLGGCLTLSPPEHRARQYSSEFSAYSAEMQQRLSKATIAPGDDRTAVYIALGKPQRNRVGYGRDESDGALIRKEFWDYSGYPDENGAPGSFITLNNGGFASALSSEPYGLVTVEFANGIVTRTSYDADSEISGTNSRSMYVPANPH